MSEKYQLDLPDHIVSAILDLPERDIALITARLARLQRDPWAGDVRRLQARDEVEFRVRAGDYRIVFTVDEEQKTIRINELDLRRDVYRRR